VKRLAAGGATDEELVKAKDQILKGFAFEFDNSMKVIARLMSYEYYGYPRDYLQQYHAHIIKVSNSDVARVAKQYLKTDQFAVLFVGDGKYEAPLTTLGAIRDIDITIPAPKQKELAAATPESIARGRKLLGAARSAMGGAALSGVKDYTLILEAKVDTPGGPMNLKMENSASAGGKFLQKIQTPMGEMKIGFDGDSAWMSGGGHTQDLPGSQKAEYQNSSMRETIWLLQRQEETLTVQSLGVADFEGTKAEAVVLSDPARKLEVTLYLDPSTNMIIGKRYVSAAMGPPTETDEVYSDYRDVNGIKAPYKTAVWQGGKMKGEMTVSEVRINPGIPDTAYKKP
jgi:hypothetical protein